MSRQFADAHPQWNGLVPHQLFARLDAEPVVGNALRVLGRALLAELDGRTAEIVALRVAAVRGCAYVWAGHVVIARTRRDGGHLTEAEIAGVRGGPDACAEADATLVATIDRLLAGGPAAAHVGAPPLSLTTAVCFYDLVCTVMADAEPDAPAVPGLELTAGPARRSAAAQTGR